MSDDIMTCEQVCLNEQSRELNSPVPVSRVGPL
jgi:hypothetical protein